MSLEIRVPDIGDAEAVEVIEICAAVGDTVGAEDALVVIESDKASMEIPAGAEGTLVSIEVGIGDEVTTGTLLARLDSQQVSTGQADESQPASEATVEEAADDQAVPAQPTSAAAASPAPESSGSDAGEQDVEVRVPDIGDATDVEVIEVAVTAGERVGADDLLVVVESDKASMEIPAGVAGSVSAVHVEVGSAVTEGSLLVTIRSAAADATATSEAVSSSAPVAAQSAAAGSTVLPAGERRPASPAPRQPEPEPEPEPEPAARKGAAVYAGPAVRKLARELGVDLSVVQATGTRGRIVKDDVKSFVKSAMSKPAAGGSGIPPIPDVDHGKFGEVETLALSRIRAAGAVNLHRAWLNIPHVTQNEDADVTELEVFRRSLKAEALRRELKVTPLSFIIKACVHVLKAFPTFNASLDAQAKNIVLKRYYHIGFAVDTEAGLVVPVIHDADKLGIWELSEAIADLAEKARTASLSMNDMRGGSFSITSLGNLGGTGFTPIINAPEVAILGVSRLDTRPVWQGDEFVPRQLLPLSLSYDHRAINGAEAGRFMAALVEVLADIRRLSL